MVQALRQAMSDADALTELALKLARRAREACGHGEVALSLELGSRREA